MPRRTCSAQGCPRSPTDGQGKSGHGGDGGALSLLQVLALPECCIGISPKQAHLLHHRHPWSSQRRGQPSVSKPRHLTRLLAARSVPVMLRVLAGPAGKRAGFPRLRLLGVALLSLLLGLPGLALGAELHLREALLEAQRDRVTATITAVVDHLGDRAHPLSEDCDLHVPLRSREIRVAFIGEVKNACSERPPGTTGAYWSDRLYEETHGLAVSVTGVFRIWLEHPPSGDVVQTEAVRVPWYGNSNPDHQVELHPLIRVGSLDFTGHIKRIQEGSEQYRGYGPQELQAVLSKKLTIQRIMVQGEPYVRLQGTKTGYNHWNLRGRVVEPPEALADGTRVHLDVLDGNQVIPGAVRLPAVAVAGTAANTKMQSLVPGNIVQLQALGRIHVSTILDQLSLTAKQIPLPVEFVLLDLELEQ